MKSTSLGEVFTTNAREGRLKYEKVLRKFCKAYVKPGLILNILGNTLPQWFTVINKISASSGLIN